MNRLRTMGLRGGGWRWSLYSRHTRSVLQATRRKSLEVFLSNSPPTSTRADGTMLRIIPIKPPGRANYSHLSAGDFGAGGRRRRLGPGLGADVHRPATGSGEAAFQQRTWRSAPTGSKVWSAAQSGSAKGQRGTGGNPRKGRVRLWGPARVRPRRTGRPPGLACTGGGVHRTRRRRVPVPHRACGAYGMPRPNPPPPNKPARRFLPRARLCAKANPAA